MLIVEFLQYHSVLCGRVLAMSEDLRGKGILHEKGVFSISSKTAPSLAMNNLYVRGMDTGCDETAFCW